MTENNLPSLIDSNILIYAYDKSESAKQPIAEKILEDIFLNKRQAVISTQNISEFFVNVTNKIQKPISKTEAKYIIQEIISMSNVKVLTMLPSTILKAIETSAEFNVAYWDSLIAATMQENNIYTILTENEKDFSKIPFIKAVNPFSKTAAI